MPIYLLGKWVTLTTDNLSTGYSVAGINIFCITTTGLIWV